MGRNVVHLPFFRKIKVVDPSFFSPLCNLRLHTRSKQAKSKGPRRFILMHQFYSDMVISRGIRFIFGNTNPEYTTKSQRWNRIDASSQQINKLPCLVLVVSRIDEQSIYIKKMEFDFPAQKYIVPEKSRNNPEKSKTYGVYLLYRYRGPHSAPPVYYIGRFSI